MAQGKRPLGVTILGILFILLALLYFLGGLGLVAVGGLSEVDFSELFGNISSTYVMILGAIILLVGIFYLLIGVGCLKGWGWVWTLAVVFTIIGLILTVAQAIIYADLSTNSLINLGINILISLIILWYLFRQNVKAWFGKAPAPA
jgi:hypothetical protein